MHKSAIFRAPRARAFINLQTTHSHLVQLIQTSTSCANRTRLASRYFGTIIPTSTRRLIVARLTKTKRSDHHRTTPSQSEECRQNQLGPDHTTGELKQAVEEINWKLLPLSQFIGGRQSRNSSNLTRTIFRELEEFNRRPVRLCVSR